jgi:hypothetical protein
LVPFSLALLLILFSALQAWAVHDIFRSRVRISEILIDAYDTPPHFSEELRHFPYSVVIVRPPPSFITDVLEKEKLPAVEKSRGVLKSGHPLAIRSGM